MAYLGAVIPCCPCLRQGGAVVTTKGTLTPADMGHVDFVPSADEPLKQLSRVHADTQHRRRWCRVRLTLATPRNLIGKIRDAHKSLYEQLVGLNG